MGSRLSDSYHAMNTSRTLLGRLSCFLGVRRKIKSSITQCQPAAAATVAAVAAAAATVAAAATAAADVAAVAAAADVDVAIAAAADR